MGVLIVHAGLPKTATSALQAALHMGRHRLAEAGILWPEAVKSQSDPRHIFLSEELLRQGSCPTLFAALAEARTRGLQTVIVSSESLTNKSEVLSGISASAMSDALRGWTVRLVFGVRDRDSWQRSRYRQCILNPPLLKSTIGLEPAYATGETFEVWRKRPAVAELGDVNIVASRLAPLFGDAETIVFEQGKDVVRDFMTSVGLDASIVPEAPHRNVSPSPARIEILRRANASRYKSRLNPAMRGLLAMETGEGGHIGLSKHARRPTGRARAMVALWLLGLRFRENPGLDLSPSAFEEARRSLIRAAILG